MWWASTPVLSPQTAQAGFDRMKLFLTVSHLGDRSLPYSGPVSKLNKCLIAFSITSTDQT